MVMFKNENEFKKKPQMIEREKTERARGTVENNRPLVNRSAQLVQQKLMCISLDCLSVLESCDQLIAIILGIRETV